MFQFLVRGFSHMCRLGEARQSGYSAVTAQLAVFSRWASIFRMTAGSSILAMILTLPPHLSQLRQSHGSNKHRKYSFVLLQGTMAEILNRCGPIALKSVTHFYSARHIRNTWYRWRWASTNAYFTRVPGEVRCCFF